MTRAGEACPLRPQGRRHGRSPAPAKFGATGAALRGARVPPRAVPSVGSVPPPLPGQDKGSLTRDGTALHKWDWSEREPETERQRRQRQGPHERGEATGACAGGDLRPHAEPGGARGRTHWRARGRGEARGRRERRGRQSRSLSRAGAEAGDAGVRAAWTD